MKFSFVTKANLSLNKQQIMYIVLSRINKRPAAYSTESRVFPVCRAGRLRFPMKELWLPKKFTP